MEWIAGSKVYGNASLYQGQELTYLKFLSDQRAEGKGHSYLLKLSPPQGKMIKAVANARSDEHIFTLSGGYCDRSGAQRTFPGDYILNPEGHPHGIFCAVETVNLQIYTGEGDEVIEFAVIDLEKEILPGEDRYQRGWEKLKEIDGEAGARVIESLKEISPDLGRYIIEFGFGDIYSRPGLDLRSREIATLAALTALGNASPQLKVHIHAALNVGCRREEIVEVILQMAVYAGFPAALNGMFAAKEVFQERDQNRLG